MPQNIGIKSYYKQKKQAYPSCHVCGKSVRFPAKCDNCHQTVCNRHRPAFVKPWYCSKCIDMWQQWANNNPDAGEQILNQTTIAEQLYNGNRIVEADKQIDAIFDFLTNDIQREN
jgi:hypothetical protein